MFFERLRICHYLFNFKIAQASITVYNPQLTLQSQLVKKKEVKYLSNLKEKFPFFKI